MCKNQQLTFSILSLLHNQVTKPLSVIDKGPKNIYSNFLGMHAYWVYAYAAWHTHRKSPPDRGFGKKDFTAPKWRVI